MTKGTGNKSLEAWVQVGSLIQALVVVVGVGLTLYEFVLKDRDLIRLRRETTIRVAFDEKLKVEDAESFAYLRQYLECKDPDVDSRFKWGCSEFSKPPPGLSDYRAMEKLTRPLYARLSRIAICIKAELCDADLAKHLVCTEVRMFSAVNRQLSKETKVASGFGLPVAELLKDCEDGRFDMMW